METEALLDPMYQPETGGKLLLFNLYSILQSVLFALVALVLISTFVGKMIGVDGTSMVPTLHHGDMIVLQSLGYTPKRGDVVVFTQRSYSDTPLVKRVIATEGQTVDIDYDANAVYVDGVKLSEPYLGEPMRWPTWTNSSHIEVPQGSICVLGDNRNNSTDSRSPLVGTVDTRCVLGRGLGILFPLQDFGRIP